MSRRVNVEKGKQGFQPGTAGKDAIPTAADGTGGWLSRLRALFGLTEVTARHARALAQGKQDSRNALGLDAAMSAYGSMTADTDPFSDAALSAWEPPPAWSPSAASGMSATPTYPRPSYTDEIAHGFEDAWEAAKADYRFGPGEKPHARIAVMVERFTAAAATPRTYPDWDGKPRTIPFDAEATVPYVRQVAHDIVDSVDGTRGMSPTVGVYSADTIARARRIVAVRDSSGMGANVPDYFERGNYTQPDGTVIQTWYLKQDASFMMSGAAADQRKNPRLTRARDEQAAYEVRFAARLARDPWADTDPPPVPR
jgi:hypothetical protein